MTWAKTSRQSRGYGAEWDRLRPIVFQRDHGICQRCGNAPPKRDLRCDHIKPKAHGGTDDLTNLQTLCVICNDIKTIEDNGGKPIERPPIGLDGFPRGW